MNLNYCLGVLFKLGLLQSCWCGSPRVSPFPWFGCLASWRFGFVSTTAVYSRITNASGV